MLFGDFVASVVFPGFEAFDYTVNALHTDRQGNIYRVEKRGEQNELVVVDSVGNEFVNRVLPELGDASRYFVPSVFAASNGNILATAVEYEQVSEKATAISLHRYHEDGSYGGLLLHIPCEQSVSDSLYNRLRFSEFSIADGTVYFGVLGAGEAGDRVDVYALGTDPLALPEKAADYPDPGYSFFLPLDASQGVGVRRDGKLDLLAEGKPTRMVALEDGGLPGHMWAGDEEFFIQDLTDKDIYQLTFADGIPTLLLKGSAKNLENGGEKLSLQACDWACVSPGGRITALQTKEKTADIYIGGARYLRLLDTGNAGFNMDWFWVGAILLGVVLLSLLAWDIYVGLLKGRVSIMVKQALLVVLCAILLLYGVLRGVLQPSIDQTLHEHATLRMKSAAQTLTMFLEKEKSLDLQPLFLHLQVQEERNDIAPLHVELYEPWNDGWRLTASSDGAPTGAGAGYIPFRVDLFSDFSVDRELVIESYEYVGLRRYYITQLTDGRRLAISLNCYQLERELEALTTQTSRYLMLAGSALVAALLLVQYAQVRALRRLKRCVDRVSAGEYEVEIKIASGDEVESLANSFHVMTRFIHAQLMRLEQMNEVSVRFIPRSLLRLLGGKGLEEIDRSTHIKYQMTVLLARFYTCEEQTQNADHLFAEINRALELLTPAVAANGGTIYGFEHNGFYAVFEGGQEQAVRAALQIREAAMTQDSHSGKEMDARVALVSGEVLLGVIGNEERLQPTVVSEAVRVANGLIGLCKESSIYIACADDSVRELEGYKYRYVGIAGLPGGRETPLYDLYSGDPYALRKHKESVELLFDCGVKAYYAKEYTQARGIFMQILKLSVEDSTTRGYLYLADRYCTEGCDHPDYKPFV